ncbi:glycosyltransferase [Niveibacterium sp. SC-1]|uniref:glycosyltransferase n=1 Tax=Niveibacterium sp. SC-1 TaxID=3135646 RepID=UPI00311E7A0C
MVAFHFPPHAGSSGIQRSLRFAQQLPRHGWDVEVLTVTPDAYESRREDLLAELPADLPVHRALALDAKRQLSIAGRYPGFLARPDRWRSWYWPAVLKGRRLLASQRFDALWSTFPIATAHRIGATLARTGLPWIADLRDPMAHDGYPRDPATWRSYHAVERKVFARASRIVTVTQGCADYYAGRYPDAAARLRVIRNAHDEDAFAAIEARAPREALEPGAFTLLHSGLIYPWERDPGALFAAIGRLCRERPELAAVLRLRLRAPGDAAWLVALAREHQIEGQVQILPALPFADAVEEMYRADALLVLQAANCNLQIPAKLYEYARCARPVLALTDPAGDTWREAAALAGSHCVDIGDAGAIANVIAGMLARGREADLPVPDRQGFAGRTEQLARLLDEVLA